MNFKNVLNSIAQKMGDLTSLEVTTYTGQIDLTAQGVNVPTNFDGIIAAAKANANISIRASTLSKIDGDTQVFYASDATAEDKEEHRQIVEVARENRKATLGFFEEAIKKALE